MNTPTPSNIFGLKRLLRLTLQKNNYDLLSPEVLAISQQLDLLLNPLFKQQL